MAGTSPAMTALIDSAIPRHRLTEITGQFLHGCGQGGAPEGHAARLRLRFTGETPRGDFSVDSPSEKDNPCYGVFSVLKYGPPPFGIWRTRIWKMPTAEPIAAGEADGRTESPGNGAATP